MRFVIEVDTDGPVTQADLQAVEREMIELFGLEDATRVRVFEDGAR